MSRSNNQTIAKNTLLLYFRMAVTMIVSLYTSRVVLQILGVDDYGIYQAVGGIVAFLGFINNALGTGSSRFIAFGLGEDNIDKLKKIFSTTLFAHIILAIFIVIIAETAGVWFLENKLNIPEDRFDAAEFAYHLSILTAFLTLTQVPYNACIIAHERMNIYAVISIIEAVSKLLIVYALSIGGIDKLKLYATLLCVLQVCIMLYYRHYCNKHFEECRIKLCFDKKLFKEIASFSGWSLFASSAIALNSHGVLLLLNMFFSPAVVAARSISIQVNLAANQLVTNFQTASVPQIVKRYASKDYEGSKQLLLQTAKFSYYLMLLMSLPLCLVSDQLLEIWLGVVPEYTGVFLRIIILQSLFQIFDTTFYYALYAKGRLRENALISPTIAFIQFPVVYFLFKNGFSPVALSWASFVVYAILGLVIKPILVVKVVNYRCSDIISVIIPCLKVTIVSSIIPLLLYFVFLSNTSKVFSFIILTVTGILSVIVTCWLIGIEPNVRSQILSFIKVKLSRINS